jgi:protein-tyrosine phosphatase
MSSTDLRLGAVPQRHLRLAGTRNLRDVGGYPAGDGRWTRWRTLFRTDRLDRLTREGQEQLLEIGIGLVIDLRWPDELTSAPSVFASSPDVRYMNIPVFDESPPETDTSTDIYRAMVDAQGERLAEVVKALLSPGGLPAVVGCAAGKDRTGVAIAIVLEAVGVPRDVIVADYMLSTECFATPMDGADPDDPLDGVIAVECEPALMTRTLEYVERRHGGARELLRRQGLSTRDLDQLVELLVEWR